MSNDQFAKSNSSTDNKTNQQHDSLVEQRERPELPETNLQMKDGLMKKPEKSKKKRKAYSDAEVLEKATAYFNGDSLAANVWMHKYALKDSNNNIYELSPDDMHWRIAYEVERIERKYPNPLTAREIYEVLQGFNHIVPQGSPMSGIGNDFQVSSLSNCFVIGQDRNFDSYGGILKVDQEQVQLMKRRGGVGHDLSHIRPGGSPVKNSALTSTGVVPFMERFSNSTREVAQDGRRGALMLSISIKHPDAENFIDAKMEQGKVTGANVSVKVDNEFMEAVRNNKTYTQKFPINSENPTVTNEIDARELWEKIIHNAWQSAEPGILFWDTVIGESVPDSYSDLGFKTLSTNPCGEIPLCPYDSCRLLAINLYSYVDEPFTTKASFNYEKFKKHVHLAQRIMDDIIDLEIEKVDAIINKVINDPEDDETKRTELRLWEKIKEKSMQGRRTGIGITAEGDMLAALGITYGTKESINFSVDVHKTLAVEAYRSSVELAEQRGCFPIFDFSREKKNPFINRISEVDPSIIEKMEKAGRRNIALLTIAPTGSVSICTQTTSGIEPVFRVSYKRRRKINPNDRNAKISFTDKEGDTWEEYKVFHSKFFTWLEINGYNPDEVRKYSDEQMEELIAKSPYYLASANDINWVNKVKLQGAVQKWVDHSISVTVNLPKSISESMVSQVYTTAWESGCKGMTIYRDGSRPGVLFTDDSNKKENEFKEHNAPTRPKKLKAEVVRFKNEDENWLAVVGLLHDRPYEIFTGNADGFWLPQWVTKGWVIKNKNSIKIRSRYDFQFEDKDGYKVTIEGLSRSFSKEFWNYAKLISGILRHGMPLPYAVDLIENLTLDRESINTWKNGVTRALRKFIPNGTRIAGKPCPVCGSEDGLMYKEGCMSCTCGYSACS